MSVRFSQVFVGSNLKMYKTIRQTLEYTACLQTLTGDIPRDSLRLFILPSYTALADACRTVDHSLIWVGAQNMHWADQGQFTGEISAPMLQEIGVDLVMAGHAERRVLFGETDEMVNRRVLACLSHGFQVLVCVGETAEDKSYRVSIERLAQQLKIALHNVRQESLSRVWLAYEPSWAIGEQGIPADPEYINDVHLELHQVLEKLFPSHGSRVPVLYGGSVGLNNAANIAQLPEVDGLFIGRAAWDAKQFNQIIRSIQAAN